MQSLHCLPWNQNHRDSDLGYPLCTRDKASHFLLTMAATTVIEFVPSVDTRLLDPAMECQQDPGLQMQAFRGINTRASLFFWKAMKSSKMALRSLSE